MKKKLRKTGEIVDVISYSKYSNTSRNSDLDWVSYIDSKSREHERERGLNIYWDFEDIEEVPSTDISWEQYRLELVKTITHGQLTGPIIDGIDPNPSIPSFAKQVVKMADAIIEELKKEDKK